MAGKRRAAGPAVKKPATKAAGKPGAKPTKKTGRQRFVTFLKWSTLFGVIMAILGATAVVVLYKAIDVPNPNEDFETETTFVYYADGKTQLGKFAEQNRNSIPFEEIPEHMRAAVVAAEDRSFWTNPGIDLKGIVRAALSNARGNSKQGASTITQQYVKIFYLTQERSYKRKVKEAILARKIADQQTKEQVLEGYLNTIYFGRGAYGIDAAANAYFNKPAKELTLQESAVLASVINNPTQFDPANGEANKAALFNRYKYVLAGMNEMGEATAAEVAQASAALPVLPEIKGQQSNAGQRGHAMALIKKELLRTGAVTEEQIAGGGLRVTTTLTRKAMRAAEQGVNEVRPKGLKGLHTAVASVEPGTGALRGFYGGQDYLESQINWAVSGGQPGSTFKPFALAAGIDAGYSLKDTFEGNSPLELPDGKEVKNLGEDGGTSYGKAINLIKATEDSVNTAYVDLTLGLPNGPADVVSMAEKLGIPPNDGTNTMDRLHNSPGLSANTTVALGSASVSPINMANAYATIANGGEAAEVYVIDKVVDRTGEVLYRHKAATESVLSADIAADVTYALQQVIKTGSGTKVSIGRPVAGKTGTATAGEDRHVSSSWFVGFTPQMATAVMYVRGTGTETLEGFLEPYYGGTYPALTWDAVMTRLMEGVDIEDFPPPAYVDGKAPEDGHSPVKPTPKPTPKPPTTSIPPTTSAPPTTDLPTEGPPSTPPGQDCTLIPLPPSCPTDSPSPTDSTSASADTNPKPPKPRAYREEYAVS